ncbi:MAG: large subunit ribosomal protein L17 [Chitinophagales bacterium]|jgi:large subunit ribosomal protein L17
MRHANKINKLSRKTAHRKAMFENMSSSLILNKRIFTTVAKAKALRVYLEPVITKAKNNDTHNRRTVYSYLGSNSLGKEASKELFDVIAPKVGDRPGGYLRIIKTDQRAGDNADMAMIEFVDFNDIYTQSEDSKPDKKKSRRGGKKKATTPAPEAKVEEVKEEAPAEEIAEESPAEDKASDDEAKAE